MALKGPRLDSARSIVENDTCSAVFRHPNGEARARALAPSVD